MSYQGYVFPSFLTALGQKAVHLDADTLQVLLIDSGSPALAARTVTDDWVTVADFLANNGTALTEVSTSGTGYTRKTLTGVSFAAAALVSTLTAANVDWASSTISATQAVFFDNSVGGTDATNQLICYWDFGGAASTSNQTFTLNISAAGLVTWTAPQ